MFHNLIRLKRLFDLYKEYLTIKRMITILLSTFVLSIIELAGITLIFPFLKLVTDTSFHRSLVNKAAEFGLDAPLQEQRYTVMIVGITLVIIFIFKGIIQVLLIRYQARAAADSNRFASNRIIEQALYSRFKLFQEQSAVKLASISQANTMHCSLLFMAVATSANEIILMSFIFVGASLFAPTATMLALVVIMITGFCFLLPISRRVALIGGKTQEIDLARYRFVFAMANAIRDIKIMGLELIFLKRNKDITDKHVDLAAEYTAISAVPRISIEVIMVCIIVFACFWLEFSGGDIVESAPILVTIGLIAVRVGPAFSRLAVSYNSFRYSLPLVETLISTQVLLSKYPQTRIDDKLDLVGDYQVTNLTFGYNEQMLLRNLSINFPMGKAVAIIGKSGSGKSTLLDLLAGLQQPLKGDFSMGGIPFQPFLSSNFCSQLGYVPQSISILDGSIAFNISLEEMPDNEYLMQAIERAHLTTFVTTLQNGVNTLIGEGGQGISGGQKQRIGIARALYRQPKLLILDEVTSSLDQQTQAKVMSELFQLRGQTTLLIVTHEMSSVDGADHRYQLINGTLHPC